MARFARFPLGCCLDPITTCHEQQEPLDVGVPPLTSRARVKNCSPDSTEHGRYAVDDAKCVDGLVLE